MENKNNPIDLNDAIRAMKETTPSAEQAQASQARVLAALKTESPVSAPGRLRSGTDYSSLLAPYLRNELSEAQTGCNRRSVTGASWSNCRVRCARSVRRVAGRRRSHRLLRGRWRRAY